MESLILARSQDWRFGTLLTSFSIFNLLTVKMLPVDPCSSLQCLICTLFILDFSLFSTARNLQLYLQFRRHHHLLHICLTKVLVKNNDDLVGFFSK